MFLILFSETEEATTTTIPVSVNNNSVRIIDFGLTELEIKPIIYVWNWKFITKMAFSANDIVTSLKLYSV